jgi:hypothetical protein
MLRGAGIEPVEIDAGRLFPERPRLTSRFWVFAALLVLMALDVVLVLIGLSTVITWFWMGVV